MPCVLPGMAGTAVGNYLGRPLLQILSLVSFLATPRLALLLVQQLVYIALVTPGGTVSADVRAVSPHIGIPLAILAIKHGLDPSSVEAASQAAAISTSCWYSWYRLVPTAPLP